MPPSRREPLRAAPVPAAAPDPSPEAPPVRSRARGALVGTGIGLGVGLATIAVAFSVVAIPLFMLASVEPDHGLDRDLVRTGLFHVALPVGLVAGLLVGALVGVWSARGGRLPAVRTGLHDR